MSKHVALSAVVIALAIGFGAGALTGAFSIQRALFSAVSDQDAWDTIERVEVLSRLRLGETERAISILEMPLADQVLFIHDTQPAGEMAREGSQFRALLAAKAYLNLFPTTEPNAEAVDDALRKVPILLDKDHYTDGLNKLIERFQPVPLAPSVGA
jgi:hypothetical protein